MSEFDLEYALITMQGALLGMVVPSLRAVSVQFDPEKKLLTYYYIYDCAIDDALSDLASCSATEASAKFPANYDFEYHIEELGPSKPIPSRGLFAYLRNEKKYSPIAAKPISFSLQETKQTNKQIIVGDLLFPMQQALLGKVTPSLRAVKVNLDDATHTLECSFFYDGKITDELYDLASQTAITGAAPFAPNYTLKLNVEQLDFPNKIQRVGRWVYKRREENHA